MSDIVEWLREGYPATRPDRLLEAADEIVALRAKCIELSADRTRQLVADRRAKVLEEAAQVYASWQNVMAPTIRDEALEEAAQACVGSGAIVAEARLCASSIRALKGKRDG